MFKFSEKVVLLSFKQFHGLDDDQKLYEKGQDRYRVKHIYPPKNGNKSNQELNNNFYF